MALVKCPECGKENVSNNATQCPNCGYNIKEHYEQVERKIKYEKEQKNIKIKEALQLQQIQKHYEETYQKIVERKCKEIDKMSLPEEPNYFRTIFDEPNSIIVVGICMLSSLLLGIIEKSTFLLVVFILLLIIVLPIILISKYKEYSIDVDTYNEMVVDFDRYKKTEKEKVIQQYKNKATEDINGKIEYNYNYSTPKVNKVKCPACGSTNCKGISALNRTVSVATMGIASSKIGKQFECNNCGYKF